LETYIEHEIINANRNNESESNPVLIFRSTRR
jgi:hypothetical protein